jgi:hypothetical protein
MEDEAPPESGPKRVRVLGADIYEGSPPAPLPPISPDGGFPANQQLEQPASVPAATPEAFICLRGPCRHYWELDAFFESGNPEGTFEELGVAPPRQIARTCTVMVGVETELTEAMVYRCNRWDPYDPEELVTLDARRRRYYERHPDHLPAEDDPAVLAMAEDAPAEEGNTDGSR